jgi:hypothetical protein
MLKYLLLLAAGLAITVLPQDRVDTMLKVLALKESGDNPLEIRTRFQFIKSTWQQHSSMDWDYMNANLDSGKVQAEVDATARRHLLWIISRLKANGREVTPFRMALAWRMGMTGSLRQIQDIPIEYIQYAEEAENLYFSL